MSPARPLSPMATIITPDPHFSERFSMRMITLLVWTGLLALAGGGLWWYGHSFLDTATLEALYQDAFPVLVLAGPMALVMLAGGLDLSIGSVMALASVLTATALRNGASPQDAFILVMLFAGGIGLIHALLTGLLAINSAVVTFVSAVLIHQLALVYAGDLQELPFGGPGFIESLHCSPMVLGAAAGAAMFLILLAQIGGQAGKDPITQQKWYRRVMFISLPYVLSSMAAGVVGSTQAAAVSEGSTNPKQTTVLMVIFAALVGGNCSGRRFGTVIGAVAGAAILVVLEYYLRIMEAMKSEMAMMIIASAAGAGLLLSHLTYCLINRLYRKSRQKAEA